MTIKLIQNSPKNKTPIMKKLILAAVVASGALFLMASCTSKTATNENDLVSKIENCTNTDSIQVYVEQAKAYAQKLVSEGKVDEAKKYLEKIEPVVKAKAPQLAGVLSTVESAMDKVKDVAGNATDEVKAAGDSAVNAAGEAVENAKEAAENAKEAAAAAVENAKDEAAAKVSDAAQKASEKVSDAAQKAADKAADKVNDLLKKK